ncbi:large ribosomal subunit protein mL49-like isoform X2 [Artemia franciscana]|uniref:large ribosomal subunit protein mL49-like isoform X2 n=1 Tax=Artemia franciscana TaxID=6661 RepID=UPI0032DB9199
MTDKIKTKIPWNPYFNPKLPLNPTVGPSELYTNVEEVKVDWKNIERLFPQQTVPIPPVKETYPSGWVPPKGSSLDCPYHVKRSRNHMLPVYFVNRTVKTQRGGWSYTQILHIEGDIWALEKDLKDYLEEYHQQFVPSQVHELSRWIRFKEDHVNIINSWLIEKGF